MVALPPGQLGRPPDPRFGPPLPPPPPLRTGPQFAAWWERWVARILDNVLIGAVATLGDVIGLVPLAIVAVRAHGAPTAVQVLVTGWLWFAVIGVFYGVSTYLYEVVLFRGTGRTLGKRVLKLYVVRATDGTAPDRRTLRRRWLTQFGPMAIGYILFPLLPVAWCYQVLDGLSPLWNKPARQSWHDRYAGTVVIREGA